MGTIGGFRKGGCSGLSFRYCGTSLTTGPLTGGAVAGAGCSTF